MANATFAHLKRPGSTLFVVQIEGRLGPRDRKAIEEFAQRCRDKGKSEVVFELSNLQVMSGGVAASLGQFASHQAERGHPVLFVGASETVQRFLEAQFKDVLPVFVESLEEAEAVFAEDGGRGRLRRPGDHAEAKAPPPDKSTAPGGPGPTAESPAEVERTVQAIHDGAAAVTSSPGRGYLSLADAEHIFAEGGDLFGVKHALASLLHGADLADECHLFALSGKHFMEVGDPSLTLSSRGPLASFLQGRASPVEIADLGDEELAPGEADLLTMLNTQLVVPVLEGSALQAVFCVRKALPGHEYSPSDVLAVELLGRHLGTYLGGRKDTESKAASGGDSARLRRQVANQRSALGLGRELTGIHDEDQLLNQLLVGLLSILGVESAAYYQWKDGQLFPRLRRGGDDADLPSLGGVKASALEEWTGPMATANPQPKALVPMARKLLASGFPHAICLRSPGHVHGMLVLGPKINRGEDPDLELFSQLTGPAASALENAHRVQKLHVQALGVAKKFVTLFERRAGKVQATNTDRVVNYVVRLARAMNHPPEHIRDLLYGTVLRDIGMVEITDLVLRSPRSLTPEEWKIVQRHPETGAETLDNLGFHPTVLDIVRHHHERFNGEGYPRGLQGGDIPLGARIVSVAESFVAMTQDLPYRPALEVCEALDVLKENWGVRYDPAVVEAFLAVYESDEDPHATPPDILELNVSLGAL